MKLAHPTVVAAAALVAVNLLACSGPLTTGLLGGSAWTTSTHPCVGNRTDAMWFDDDTTGYVGCGSTTDGKGLYRTTTGGLQWEEVVDEPAGLLSSFRVSSLQRTGDGKLLIGGTGDGYRVLSLGDGDALSVEMKGGGKVWNNFQAGTARVAADGTMVAESLTGTGIVIREPGSDEWRNAEGWWGSADSMQILDMEVHDGQFFGVGSRISQPPHVFVPKPGGKSPAQWQPMALSELITGELWSIDVDAESGRLVVGGVNQKRGQGIVWVSGAEWREPSDWTFVNVADIAVNADKTSTWIRGVCRRGDKVMAVGEYSRKSDGLALYSADGGKSFSDVTPVDAPVLSQCQVLPSGAVVATGASGWFGRFWM